MRLVTFDLWQTLIRDAEGDGRRRGEARLRYFAEALERFGWSIPADTLKFAYESGWRSVERLWYVHRDVDIPEQIAAWLGPLQDGHPDLTEAQQEELAALYVRPFQELLPEVIPGAIEAVRAAQESGFTVGLVSNTGRTPGWALRECLEQFGLARHFHFMLFSNEQGIRKPAPGIFRRAAARAGCESGLHVGDSYLADVVGARAAGWRSVLLSDTPLVNSGPRPDLIWSDIGQGAEWFRAQKAGAA
jgi:putative hydrolase of the HAD superfamily